MGAERVELFMFSAFQKRSGGSLLNSVNKEEQQERTTTSKAGMASSGAATSPPVAISSSTAPRGTTDPPVAPPTVRRTVGSIFFNAVTPMWRKVEGTLSPRVVEPSEARNKSWASSSGVIVAAALTREFYTFLLMVSTL